MKINIISDIHADVNKTGAVRYHLPYRHTKRKCANSIKQLQAYFANNREMLERLDYCKYALFKRFPNIHVVKSYDNAIEMLNSLVEKHQTDFVGMTNNDIQHFIDGLNCINRIFCANNIDWNHKTNALPIYDIVDCIYKRAYSFDPSKLESADYLIIAGDLGLDCTYDKILNDIKRKTKGKFKKILHIAGNHDHWWFRINGISDIKPDSINLSRDYCEHSDGDYLFLGCTLWTPVLENAMFTVEKYMNDYRYSPGQFNAKKSSNLHRQQAMWLRSKIEANQDKKIIVFTHHQPFSELVDDDRNHDGNLKYAYAVMDKSLDDINRHGNIKLWCCGHTHQNFDGMLHDVHVVRNPIGYSDMYGFCPAENMSQTWYNKIIEV